MTRRCGLRAPPCDVRSDERGLQQRGQYPKRFNNVLKPKPSGIPRNAPGRRARGGCGGVFLSSEWGGAAAALRETAAAWQSPLPARRHQGCRSPPKTGAAGSRTGRPAPRGARTRREACRRQGSRARVTRHCSCFLTRHWPSGSPRARVTFQSQRNNTGCRAPTPRPSACRSTSMRARRLHGMTARSSTPSAVSVNTRGYQRDAL